MYSFIQEYMGDENLHFPREDEDFPFKEVYESNSYSCLQSDQFLFIPLQTADYTISPAHVMVVAEHMDISSIISVM